MWTGGFPGIAPLHARQPAKEAIDIEARQIDTDDGKRLLVEKGNNGLAGVGALRGRCGRRAQEEHEEECESVTHGGSPDLGPVRAAACGLASHAKPQAAEPADEVTSSG